MFEITRIYLFVFGALTIVGGVMGFVKAKSVASIVAGSISGLLLLVAGYLMGEHLDGGLILGLITSVLLAGRFVPAFLRTRAPMPGGMMSVLSVLGILLTAAALVLAHR